MLIHVAVQLNELKFYTLSTLIAGTVYAGLAFPKLRFSDNVKLQAGINKLVLLSIAVGLPVSPFILSCNHGFQVH
jgi:hypothetical protein